MLTISGSLSNGCYSVPPGKLASVVTLLELRQRPAARPVADQPDRSLRRVSAPGLAWYRRLYERIGRDWLWSSRLAMADASLEAILTHADVEIYAPMQGEVEAGLLELDFRQAGAVELVFFGLAPEAVGQGAGRWLMEQAQALAWRPGITRFWLHTCTLDHPAALPFYLRSGFRPYGFAVDIDDDPRLTGLLPVDAGPGVPMISD